MYSFWLDVWCEQIHNRNLTILTTATCICVDTNNHASLYCKKHCHHPLEWEAPQPWLLETNNGQQPDFRSVGVLPSLSNPLLNTEPKLLSDASPAQNAEERGHTHSTALRHIKKKNSFVSNSKWEEERRRRKRGVSWLLRRLTFLIIVHHNTERRHRVSLSDLRRKWNFSANNRGVKLWISVSVSVYQLYLQV